MTITEALNIGKEVVDYGKIRLSYGVIGNDAPIYATTNTFFQAASGGDGFISTVSFPAFGTNAFERSTQLANSELTPERARTYEIGTEIKLFHGRISADVTYYDTRSEDIIIAVQLPATTGFTSAVRNSGVITNTGWEVVLDGKTVQDLMDTDSIFRDTVQELERKVQMQLNTRGMLV